MKRWRVMRFRTAAAAEEFLNGLSIEPDQIRGLSVTPIENDAGVALVCWLTAHQQRIEQLRRSPRAEDDLTALGDDEDTELAQREGGALDPWRAGHHHGRDEDAA